MDERALRIGKNEALFREVNERIETVNEAFSNVTETFAVVCECGDSRCVEQISLAPAEYEAVRRDATKFIVRPGHDSPDVEEVVARADEYHVVKKHSGAPSALAEATDTR